MVGRKGKARRFFSVRPRTHEQKSPSFLQICIPKRDYLPQNQVIWQFFSSMCTDPYPYFLTGFNLEKNHILQKVFWDIMSNESSILGFQKIYASLHWLSLFLLSIESTADALFVSSIVCKSSQVTARRTFSQVWSSKISPKLH